MHSELTDLQRDAIGELLNIGMGTAANSLSQMVGEEVLLSVPSLEFVEPNVAARRVGELAGQHVSAVRQEFSGPFWGNSLLFFPREESLELVRSLIDQNLPLEIISDMEQEAMIEVGNIILNACMSSLADIFAHEMHTAIPTFHQGSCIDVFQEVNEIQESDEAVMFLRMDFQLREKNLSGYVAFLMDIDSMRAFRTNVDQFLGAA